MEGSPWSGASHFFLPASRRYHWSGSPLLIEEEHLFASLKLGLTCRQEVGTDLESRYEHLWNTLVVD